MEDNVSTVEMAGFSVRMRTDTKIELQRARTFSNESELVEEIITELRPDDIFWDVGANVGIYSLFAAQVITHGRIYAFEPHPTNFSTLKKNISRECPTKAEAHNIALFDERDWMMFNPASLTSGEGHGHISDDGDMKIRTIRGDIFDSPPPDVVKIDVEGAEARVLRGMSHILDDVRTIYIEAHPGMMIERYNDSIGDIIDIASRREFRVKLLFSRGTEKFFKLYRDE